MKSGISIYGCVGPYRLLARAGWWVECAVIRPRPQGAQQLIAMNIHMAVYHNDTLGLRFQTQISY